MTVARRAIAWALTELAGGFLWLARCVRPGPKILRCRVYQVTKVKRGV